MTQLFTITHAQLRTLNDAALLVASEHRIEAVLQQIVDVARTLLNARYAALGVAGPDLRLEKFIYSGMSEDEARRMHHLPYGLGLLGAIIREQRPICVAQIDQDERAIGFPDGHNPMTSFLGVPLIAQGQPVGNLYLTDKLGGAPFDELDQELAEMLGAHAALAIVKARLFDAADKQARQLAAINAASTAIASELALDKVLRQIVHAARELAQAQYAALGIPNSDGYLSEFIYAGMTAAQARQIDHPPVGHGLLGLIVRERRSIRIPRIGDDPQSVGFPAGHPPMDSFLGVPILAGGEALGNLYLTNKLTANEFSIDDQHLVEMLAANAAIAIQNARLYEQVEQLAVLEERNRIGMDLHDGVIQSIYAVGLTLESLRMVMTSDGEDGKLLDYAIEGLNGTIQDIRNFIMDLRPRRFVGDLKQGINQLVREFQANTLTPVSVHLPADARHLTKSAARAIFMTTQEALANVARHARAHNVTITLTEQGDAIALAIIDDGVGFDMRDRTQRIGHGLANMRTRATDLGGHIAIRSAPNQGTTIRLIVPMQTPS